MTTIDGYALTAAARDLLHLAEARLGAAAPRLAALSAEVAWESEAARCFRDGVESQRRAVDGAVLECREVSWRLLQLGLFLAERADATD